MASTTIVPFDFDTNKQYITDLFTQYGYDATYAGSNASILADILSYIVSMLNVNTAANVSEVLLSKATQRKNILYAAREQGYEAQNRISYQYRLTFVAQPDSTLDPQDTTLRTYEFPKYASITNGSLTYYYFGDTITKQLSNATINDGNDTSKYFTVAVKEGTLYLEQDYPTILSITTPTVLDANGNIIADNKINIPFTDVEDDGIEMTLNYVDANGIIHLNEPWYKSTQFLTDKDTNLNKKFIRLDNLETGTPVLYFNIAGVGNTLRLNTTINVNVLVSSGASGAKTGAWAISDPNLSNFALYVTSDVNLGELLLVTGADEESSTSIQVNAPLFHNSANRAVTKYDYVSICNRFSNVQFTQCWGGDEEIPVKLGNVYLSMIPTYIPTTYTADALNYNYVLDNVDDMDSLFMRKNELWSNEYDQNGALINPGVFDTLGDYKVMTMQLNNVYPFYLDFEYTINVVKYSLVTSKQATNQAIFDIINTFFIQHMSNYEVQYFHSNLVKRIDTELTDLSGINSTLYLRICIYGTNPTDQLQRNVIRGFTGLDTEMGITFYLAMPFENLYNDSTQTIIPGILPDISTVSFITTGDNLYVDFSNVTLSGGATNEYTSYYYYYNIYYNDGTNPPKICGRYYVDNGSTKHIRVDLYVLDDGSTPVDPRFVETNLLGSMFSSEVKRLNLKYSSYNLTLFKHMFPRLTEVSFA